jgi:hypothetical protein
LNTNRRSRKRGAIPPAAPAFLPPLVRQMFPLYAFYGLRRPMAARIAFPLLSSVEVRASWREKLCGNYVRVEGPEEPVLRKCLDDKEKERGLSPTRVFDHIYVQAQFAPQIVYHQPFHPSQTLPGAEVDPVLLQVGINFVLHDDQHSGFEVTAVLQGSFNYTFVDPNQNNPNETAAGRQAWQGQGQLQASYVLVNLFGVDGLSLSLLIQAARAISYQYDPTQQKNVTSRSSTLAGGFQISKSLGKDSPFSVGFQGTAGPSTNHTLDWTGQVIFQFQFDLMPPKPK